MLHIRDKSATKALSSTVSTFEHTRAMCLGMVRGGDWGWKVPQVHGLRFKYKLVARKKGRDGKTSSTSSLKFIVLNLFGWTWTWMLTQITNLLSSCKRKMCGGIRICHSFAQSTYSVFCTRMWLTWDRPSRRKQLSTQTWLSDKMQKLHLAWFEKQKIIGRSVRSQFEEITFFFQLQIPLIQRWFPMIFLHSVL